MKNSKSTSWPMFMGVLTSSSLLAFVLLGFQNCSTISSTTPQAYGPVGARTDRKVIQANCGDFATVLPPQTFSETCLAALQAQMEVGLVDDYKNLVQYSSNSGASKTNGESERFWIYIPNGKRIDISQEGQWIYPVGTRLWQEISREGQKLETREMEKITSGEGILAWRFATYLWRRDQSDAIAAKSDRIHLIPQFEDLLVSQLSVQKKIAHLNQCNSCHAGAKDAVLGLNTKHLSKLPSFWTSVRRAALEKKDNSAN